MSRRYVTLSFVLEGPNVSTDPPDLSELVYMGVRAVAGHTARASDVSISYEPEGNHPHFDDHQSKFNKAG
jgi:hypothetical protein